MSVTFVRGLNVREGAAWLFGLRGRGEERRRDLGLALPL